MGFQAIIHRDCDTLRLRKVVIELVGTDGELVDRSRMFAGFRFEKRLARRLRHMKRRAAVMKAVASAASDV